MKTKILTAAVAAIALQTSAASATILIWNYSGPGANSGSGAFDAALQGDGSYLIDSVSGTANGQAITGLDTFADADNLVYPPSPPNVGADRLGVSFDAGGVKYNLYEDNGGYTSDSPFYCGAIYCLISSASPTVALRDFSVTVDATAVPEPAIWTMMLVGLGGLGAVMRWRRRRAA